MKPLERSTGGSKMHTCRRFVVRLTAATAFALGAMGWAATPANADLVSATPTGTCFLGNLCPPTLTLSLPGLTIPFGPVVVETGSGQVNLVMSPDLGLSDPTATGLDRLDAIIDAGLDTQLSGASLEGLGTGVYAIDSLRLSAGAHLTQDALKNPSGAGGYLSDTLRLSAQTAVDGLAGADVLGNEAYVLDSLRLSGQAENALDAALIPGQGAFVSDDLRLSGLAAADRVAGAEVLGNEAYVLDSLRLSGQAANDLDAALIPRQGAFRL